MDGAMDLMDAGYRLNEYRNIYGDPPYCVVPPIWSLLEKDTTLLPPTIVDSQAGRPKGKRKRKRTQSNGEKNTPSAYNTPLSVCYGSTSAGGSVSGPSISVGRPHSEACEREGSESLPQGVFDLS